MNRKLLVTVSLLLLLCGCSSVFQDPSIKQSQYTSLIASQETTEATEPPTEPVFDPTPAFADTAVTVDGQELTVRYTFDGVLLLRLQELANMLDATLMPTTMVGTGAYICQIKVNDLTIDISNQDAAMTINDVKQALPCNAQYDGTDWYVPAQALLQAMGFTELDDAEQAHLYYTRLPDMSQIPDGIDVPVLMYHAVSDNCWGEADLFVSPSNLEEQFQYLLDNGYTPIWFEDLPHVAEIEKPIILTFDDGYDDNYTELYPLLEKYQIKATIFIIAGDLAQHHKMTAQQVTELSQSGLVSIQSHTMTHPNLNAIWREDLEYELAQSQLELTRLTGKQPFVLCYPTGYYSDESLEVTRTYYRLGLLMSDGRYITGSDPYLIPRHYVSRYADLEHFADKISEQ